MKAEFVGQIEEPTGFIQTLTCLYGDRAVETCRAEKRMQVDWQKIPLQRGHFLRDPAELVGIEFPKMLMRIQTQEVLQS